MVLLLMSFACAASMTVQTLRARCKDVDARAQTQVTSMQRRVDDVSRQCQQANLEALATKQRLVDATADRERAESWAKEVQVVARQAQVELAQRASALAARAEALCSWEVALR